jgi:hypothetical protein
MMNTKAVDTYNPPISHFTGQEAGKGIIKSPAGEILTMMSVTMNKNDFKDFKKSMLDHMKETRDKSDNYVITPDWIKAAEQNRKAILRRISKEHNTKVPSSLILNSCWDSKDEVEALGMTDPDTNKAKSSDIFLKIKTDKGEYLNEISLKKSPKAKLLNTRSSVLHKWDKNLPKDADIREYAKVQRERLKDIDPDVIKNVLIQYNIPDVVVIHEEMKKRNLTVDDVISGTSVDSRRILKMMHGALNTLGDPKSEKILKDLEDDEQRYQNAVIRELEHNDKVKEKFLEEIGGELPLKGAFNKEVSVAVGDLSIDEEVMKNVFDVKKWEHMKTHVKSFRGNPPFIGYELESSKEVIPIANIGLREYGKGFSGEMKLEMTLHPEFTKRLQSSNEEVYQEVIYESRVGEWLENTDDYILKRWKL